MREKKAARSEEAARAGAALRLSLALFPRLASEGQDDLAERHAPADRKRAVEERIPARGSRKSEHAKRNLSSSPHTPRTGMWRKAPRSAREGLDGGGAPVVLDRSVEEEAKRAEAGGADGVIRLCGRRALLESLHGRPVGGKVGWMDVSGRQPHAL